MNDEPRISPEAVIELLIDQAILEPSDELLPDSDLFAAGLDSMAMMQLVLQIEECWGIAVRPGDITRERFQSASSLARFLSLT